MNKKVLHEGVFFALSLVEGERYDHDYPCWSREYQRLLVYLCLHRANVVTATEILQEGICDGIDPDEEIEKEVAVFFGIAAGATVADVEKVLKELASDE